MSTDHSADPSKLHTLMFKRRVSLREGARLWKTSHETLRRARLPFHDPDWRRLPYEVLVRIVEWAAGDLVLSDLFPPELSAPPAPERPPADEDWASRSFLDAEEAAA